MDDLFKDLLGQLPVALKSDLHFHFVPDVLKSGAIVGLRLAEDDPVGDMDDPSGTLVGMDPVPNLQQGELEEADVNQSGGANPTCDDITISDISILIDYLFITGTGLGLADCL